jgi:hypothetical protein
MRIFIWTDELTERITQDARERSHAEASVIAWIALVLGSAVTALIVGALVGR